MKRASRSTPSVPTCPIEGQNSTSTSTKKYCIDPHQRVSCHFPRWTALISSNISLGWFQSKKMAVELIFMPTNHLQPPTGVNLQNSPATRSRSLCHPGTWTCRPKFPATRKQYLGYVKSSGACGRIFSSSETEDTSNDLGPVWGKIFGLLET